MNQSEAGPPLLDLRRGVPIDQLRERGMIAGQVDGEPVLLARLGAMFYAIGGSCSHYGGALAEGLLSGGIVRCPLHHACFDLHTGRVVRGPALADLPSYGVERRLDLVVVTGTRPRESRLMPPEVAVGREPPSRIVIVGTGAAGTAAAFGLRRNGYTGALTLVGAEAAAPYDRPNLSKSYLSGGASEEWLPLQPRTVYDTLDIRLLLGTPVSRLDPGTRTVWLEDGRALPFDALLLAPGAVPVRPPIPGMDRPHVRTLRSLADCDALIRLASSAKHAVVVGAGFLGLEAAAALRMRDLSVHVVTPDPYPLRSVLGSALGMHVQRVHEEHGVVLHVGRSVTEIGEATVGLDDGTRLPAEVVIVATGVRPNTTLAAGAGLALARGIRVNQFLETSQRGVFAAGDAVSWPDPRTGELTGCGHWSLAMRMGEAAVPNLLGAEVAIGAVPFFWSEHYDLRINCTGNTEKWDRIDVVPGLPAGQWEQQYWRDGTLVAVATMNRDHANLEAELTLEHANSR